MKIRIMMERRYTIIASVLLAALNTFFTFPAMAQDTVKTVQEDGTDSIASLKFCTTIDNDIMGKCRTELKKAMQSINGEYGQIAVVDVNTGNLKAWVALGKSDGKYKEDKLVKEAGTLNALRPLFAACFLSCAGLSLEDSVDTGIGMCFLDNGKVIQDHNWRTGGYGKTTYGKALAGKSHVAIYNACAAYKKEYAYDTWLSISDDRTEHNAVALAEMFCAMFRDSLKMYVPTLKGDTVTTEYEYALMPHVNEYVRTIAINANKQGGAQANYAPKDKEMAGMYGTVKCMNYWKDANKMLDELSFVGYSSSKSPRYAFAVFVDRKADEGSPTSPKQLSGLVNNFTQWLSER